MKENAAVYEFTAQIDDRIINAELKEKNQAIAEYKEAVQRGQTAVLLQQNERTLDTFRVSYCYQISITMNSLIRTINGASLLFRLL